MVPVGEGKYIQHLAMSFEEIIFGINWHRLEDNIKNRSSKITVS